VSGPRSHTPLRDPKSLPDLSLLSVVVVDDTDCFRTIVRDLLEVAGARRIKTAPDVAEAWDLICTHTPDLLITDWQLKGKPGIDLVRDIRHSRLSPNVFMAVMMISSFTEKPRVRRALLEGVTCYLAKPFSAEQFFSRLKHCVEDARHFELDRDYFGPKRVSEGDRLVLLD
jgi:two-component system, chemotaxis family, chemotaxis protein CheY